MLDKAGFNFFSLIVNFFILTPVFVFGVMVHNPKEKSIAFNDNQKREIVNILSRSLEGYFDKNGFYPESLEDLEYSPGCGNCGYLISADKKEIVIYDKVESLRLTEYCNGQDTSILYSSRHKRTALVCGEPKVNNFKFVN